MNAKQDKIAGQINPETGDVYLSHKSYAIRLFAILFIIVIAQYIFNASKYTLKHFLGDKLDYKMWIYLSIVLLLIYILLERFVITLPFKSLM